MHAGTDSPRDRSVIRWWDAARGPAGSTARQARMDRHTYAQHNLEPGRCGRSILSALILLPPEGPEPAEAFVIAPTESSPSDATPVAPHATRISPHPVDVRTVALLAGFLGYVVLALYMYRPFVSRPFDMVDFSEFLPILRANESFRSRFVGMVDYYASHGRLNVVVYFFLALKWSLFGANVVAWQVARAAQMLVLTLATYALLRRLNIQSTGAALGAGLMVVSAPAARAWIRLTMAEPLGATAIVVAAICGTFYQASTRWVRLAAVISALVALTLLTKEMLIAAVPLVLFLSWCRLPDGRFGWPSASPRNVGLLVVVLLATAVAVLPIAVVAVRAAASAYVSAYGSLPAGPLDLLRLELFTLIPFVALGDPMPLGLVLADLCYFGLLMIGLRLFAESQENQGCFRAILLIGLVHPLIGATVYLPWPAYQWFYSVPFLIGPAVLLGAAVMGVERVARRWRVIAYAACGCVLASMASDSLRFSRRSEAYQSLVHAAVDVVADLPGRDSVLVAAREIPKDAWQAFGQTLARYGNATDRPFPTTLDVSCETARRRAQNPGERNVLLVFSSHCPFAGSPQVVIRREFDWLDSGHGTWRRDSISVAAFIGGDSLTNRRSR